MTGLRTLLPNTVEILEREETSMTTILDKTCNKQTSV